MKQRNQKGFTLIELVIVIIILGILAAYAVPKYMNLSKNAKASVIQTAAATLRSSAEMVHGVALTNNNGVISSPITMPDGTTVTVDANGYPTGNAAGIGNAMNGIANSSLQVDTSVSNSYTLYFTTSTETTCFATYQGTVAGGTYQVTSNTSNCGQ